MATARPFAYNTGSTISGTVQVGDLAIGTPDIGFEATELEWWNGADEDLGYVIAGSVPDDSQPTPVSGVTASVQFWRSVDKTEASFIILANYITGQTFLTGNDASDYLTLNGYWNSWNFVPPTPTPTNTPTVTPTSTITPTPTTTPTLTPTNTPTNTPSITPSITPTITMTPTNTPTNTPTMTPTPTTSSLPPTITYVTNFGFSNDASTYSQNINLGGSGFIVVGISSRSVSSTSFNISGVVIDGLAATEIATIQSGQSISSFWGVNRSNTASNGIVTVNYTQPQSVMFTAIYNLKNISSFTPISVGKQATTSSGTTTVNLTLGSGSNAILALANGNSVSAITSTGVTQNLNIAVGGAEQVRFFAGSIVQSTPTTYPISIGFPSNSTFQNTVLAVNLK